MSLQPARSYRTSDLDHWQAHDPDTLLATPRERRRTRPRPRIPAPTHRTRPARRHANKVGHATGRAMKHEHDTNPVVVLVLRWSSAEPSRSTASTDSSAHSTGSPPGSSSNGSSAPTSPTTSSSRPPLASSAPSSLDSFPPRHARRCEPGSSRPRSSSRSPGHHFTATDTRPRPATPASNRSTTRPRSRPFSSQSGHSPRDGSPSAPDGDGADRSQMQREPRL